MLSKSLIFCFLVISGVLASEDGVYEWNDNDFVSELERHENTLVMFYAPWCGHSMHLMPKYAEAAELLKGNEPSITFAKIDCIKTGRKTCEKHSIRGYPTLKIFAKSDMVSNYNGPREANAIAKYMKRNPNYSGCYSFCQKKGFDQLCGIWHGLHSRRNSFQPIRPKF